MKELNFSKDIRNETHEYVDFLINGNGEYTLNVNPGVATIWCQTLCAIQKKIIEDCNTLEAEVERLREENETLKKQMEDDLK